MKNTKIEYHAAGGAVRDLLLGRRRRDVDYLCLGNESDFIHSNPGARKIEKGNASLYLVKGQEYALLDAPEDERESLLEKDISRRDFTINAMLLSSDGLVRSHPDSFEDLRQGVIRPVSSSALFDDPIRVLRAARLSAELPGF